jgi:predicted nucleic acid-binding protein
VRLAIADTSPINYLILIDHVEILPRLFARVVLPSAVEAELVASDAPADVRTWIATPPGWLEIIAAPVVPNTAGIHRGEAAAIALANSMSADLLLIDDRKGVDVARRQGLRVTGTLGVLDVAAEHGLVDFAEAIRALERTTFRRSDELLNALLAKHQKKK